MDELLEYGIEIEEEDEYRSFEHRIPIEKDDAIRLSSVLSIVPTMISNGISNELAGKTLYTISKNGEDVLPSMLFKKKNGSYISNLQGEGKLLGEQTDINAIDSTAVKAATIASTVFAVASAATSQYYLKNIDDKLSEVKDIANGIKDFLEADKQSKIESAFEILQDIIKHISAIKDDDNLRAIKTEQIAATQRESKSDISFYKKLLEKTLVDFKKNKKGWKDDNIVEEVRKDYSNYKLSLQVYALSRLAEIMMLTKYNAEYIHGIYDELKKYSLDLKEDINRVLNVIYDFSGVRIDNKMKAGFAKTARSMGNVLDKTPLKKTDLGEKLNDLGNRTDLRIEKDTKEKADFILTKEDYGTLEPYAEMVGSFERLLTEKVYLVQEGNEMYVGF